MKKKISLGIFEIILGFLTVLLGLKIMRYQGFSTRLEDWVPLTENAAMGLGIFIIFCSLVFFYFGVKRIIK